MLGNSNESLRRFLEQKGLRRLRIGKQPDWNLEEAELARHNRWCNLFQNVEVEIKGYLTRGTAALSTAPDPSPGYLLLN